MSPGTWGTTGDGRGTAGKRNRDRSTRPDGRNDRRAWTVAQLAFTVRQTSNPFSRSISSPNPRSPGVFFSPVTEDGSLFRSTLKVAFAGAFFPSLRIRLHAASTVRLLRQRRLHCRDAETRVRGPPESPATDLGYMLHKNPARVQSLRLSVSGDTGGKFPTTGERHGDRTCPDGPER